MTSQTFSFKTNTTLYKDTKNSFSFKKASSWTTIQISKRKGNNKSSQLIQPSYKMMQNISSLQVQLLIIKAKYNE